MSTFRRTVICGGALLLTGCSGVSPLGGEVVKAMRDRVQAYKSRDAAGYCRKTVVSTSLPRPLARRFAVPVQAPGPQAGIDASIRECARTFGHHGEFGKPTPDFSMEVTVDPPMQPTAGIDRTARATLRIKGGGRPLRVWFVRFRGDWKAVVEGD
jgi:hypothetical protein